MLLKLLDADEFSTKGRTLTFCRGLNYAGNLNCAKKEKVERQVCQYGDLLKLEHLIPHACRIVTVCDQLQIYTF